MNFLYFIQTTIILSAINTLINKYKPNIHNTIFKDTYFLLVNILFMCL